MDLNRLIEGIHEYIGKALSPLAARVKAIEDTPPPVVEPGAKGDPGDKGDRGDTGQKGEDGASVYIEDVLPILTEQVSKHLETVKAPDADEVAQNLALRFKGQFAEWFSGMSEKVDQHLKSLPVPQDGKDGRDAPTVEELLSAQETRFKGMFSEWALGFERMANERVERFLEAIPKPKDGLDALQVEDFDLTVSEDGRVATVSLKAAGRVIEKSIRLATLVDKDIFVPGADYEAGDGVTWGGSYWVAKKDLPTGNPGEPGSEGWRLCVKRGRDGKNGRDGIDKTAPVKLT